MRLSRCKELTELGLGLRAQCRVTRQSRPRKGSRVERLLPAAHCLVTQRATVSQAIQSPSKEERRPHQSCQLSELPMSVLCSGSSVPFSECKRAQTSRVAFHERRTSCHALVLLLAASAVAFAGRARHDRHPRGSTAFVACLACLSSGRPNTHPPWHYAAQQPAASRSSQTRRPSSSATS